MESVLTLPTYWFHNNIFLKLITDTFIIFFSPLNNINNIYWTSHKCLQNFIFINSYSQGTLTFHLVMLSLLNYWNEFNIILHVPLRIEKEHDVLVCFIAEPITRNDTVILMVMKIWISSATHEKCVYLWFMICGNMKTACQFIHSALMPVKQPTVWERWCISSAMYSTNTSAHKNSQNAFSALMWVIIFFL